MCNRFALLFAFLTHAAIGQMESVVRVEMPFGRGTGWVAAEYADRDERTYWGLVVTARHCVVDDFGGRTTASCVFSDGFRSDHCSVAAYDTDDDIAVLWCIVPDSVKPLPMAATASRTLRNLGLALPGEDEGTVDIADAHSVYWRGVVTPGDSGGPAVNDKGEVVCVVVNRTWDDWTMTTYRGGGVAMVPVRAILAKCMTLKMPGESTPSAERRAGS